MTKINYQALREAAERAIPAMECLLMLPVDDDLISEQELKDYGVDIDALNAFKFLTGPETVLALLDERERNQQYIKRRDQENEDIALTVGKLRVELEGKDSKIANLTAERDALREGEMGDARHSNTRAAADIYFQLVEECEIPAGGSLVEYVDDMREKLEAAENNLIDSECHVAELEEALRDKQALLEASEKRIAELEAEPVSQTYKLNELSGNSPVIPGGWISCSERMPDDGQHVIILCDGAFVLYAQYRDGEFFDVVRNGEEFFETQSRNVTDWMPLPEPPQEVNRG
ncbi:ead/Ea22-like family protein [Escherichia coli]|uniref:ead/Ea22-like family protein n=1 Tax=Escherichia coli TaxID=562 RepID=UPI003856009C